MMSTIAKEQARVSERTWSPFLVIGAVLGLLGVVYYFWIFQSRLPFSSEPVRVALPEVYLPSGVHVIRPPAIGSPTQMLPVPEQVRVVEAPSLASYRRVAADSGAVSFMWVIGNNLEYRTVYRENDQEWLHHFTYSGIWNRRPIVPRGFLGSYYLIPTGELGPQVVDGQLVLHWVYRPPNFFERLLGSGIAFLAWTVLFGASIAAVHGVRRRFAVN